MTERQRPRAVEQAEDWLDDHTRPAGDRPKGLEDAAPRPTLGDLHRQQLREGETITFGTEAQTRGALFGALTGAVAGAALGGLIGLLWTGSSDLTRVLIAAILLLAGSAAGFVYWGGRSPELENETMTADGRPQSGSTLRDAHTDDRGR